jgi:hypothetical protein
MSESAIPAASPGEEEVLPAENVYVRELVDNLLKDAARIAKESSKHTADELLAAAGFYVLGEIPRLQSRRVNAWNLFQRFEKENAPAEVRKQTDSVSYGKSRPGLKGDYQQYMKERWNKEPELRKKYERLAKGPAAAATADDSGTDSDREHIDTEPTLESMVEATLEIEIKPHKDVQKKSLKTLKKLVRYKAVYCRVLIFTC